ncbi:MAG: ATP-binding cassette domain-containing protein [Sphingomonadales bacterium]|nr:ATP-binding cassette domain-containing protein [Sphingomonadales bacterium]
MQVDRRVEVHAAARFEHAFGLSIGLVFQNAALFDSLSVVENVGFQLYEHTKMEPERVFELVRQNLAKVGLHNVEDLFPSQLSGGMKKRVALARAIGQRDEVLLAGVRGEAQAELRELDGHLAVQARALDLVQHL